MRLNRYEPFRFAEQPIDLMSAVKGLHKLNSQDLHKILRESENFTISFISENGTQMKIDTEALAEYLPLHLIAVLLTFEREESLLRYVLSGIRLLNSLCDIAPRHSKLEQVLLDDVRISEQLLDLVIYVLTMLSSYKQEVDDSSLVPFLHSALVASSLYLLTTCISSHWHELAIVLLAHPKVDLFIDVAFGAVRVAIGFIQMKLSYWDGNFCSNSVLTNEQTITYLSQQSGVSLQFIQSLCQQKQFRERILKNKALCENGGILFLAQAIMKLNITPPLQSSAVVAALSRLKSKILSVLLNLCEAESISYLDEACSSPEGLNLAKSVALEVLKLLKIALSKDSKSIFTSNKKDPAGLLQLNAMRLADILSDDSNFRSFIAAQFTEVLAKISLLPHAEFLSCWCSSDIPQKEVDASVESDTFAAAGWALDVSSRTDQQCNADLGFTVIPSGIPASSYAHQRTSLFVKIIANLHCFIPNIIQEQEKNLFLNKFLEHVKKDKIIASPGSSSDFDAEKAATVCINLRSLVSHAESLIPNFVNQDDVQLLRVFFNQLQSVITPEIEDNQDAQSTGGCSAALIKREHVNPTGNMKEGMSDNSAFQDVEQLCVRSEKLDQGDDVSRHNRKEDKSKVGTSAAGGMREMDEDVQNTETSASDTSSTKGNNLVDQTDNDSLPKSSKLNKESQFSGVRDKRVVTVSCEEQQRKKRKRTIMNDYQMSVIEAALLEEPDMQRNAASIQSWADKLSVQGSEVTPAQLKNWLNNRKARLARAAKDVRAASETEGRHAGPGQRPPCDSPDSPNEVPQSRSKAGSSGKSDTVLAELGEVVPSEFVQCEPGQYVMLVDEHRKEIGKGKVHQVQGKWFGRNLEETETCVVDITELKVERWKKIPYPSEATGNSFDEAEKKNGVMRIMWDSNKIYMLRSQ